MPSDPNMRVASFIGNSGPSVPTFKRYHIGHYLFRDKRTKTLAVSIALAKTRYIFRRCILIQSYVLLGN